jgi:hypothetical protein
MNGTKATELLMLANEIRRKDVSQRIANAANATRPFQLVEEDAAGKTHALTASNATAAADTAATRAWIR